MGEATPKELASEIEAELLERKKFRLTNHVVLDVDRAARVAASLRRLLGEKARAEVQLQLIEARASKLTEAIEAEHDEHGEDDDGVYVHLAQCHSAACRALAALESSHA